MSVLALVLLLPLISCSDSSAPTNVQDVQLGPSFSTINASAITMTPIIVDAPGVGDPQAVDGNDQGLVVGTYTTAGGDNTTGFAWTARGGTVALETPEGRGFTPLAVNASGVIAGGVGAGHSLFGDVGVRWPDGSYQWLDKSALPVLTGFSQGAWYYGSVVAINDANQVAGWYVPGGEDEPVYDFVWDLNTGDIATWAPFDHPLQRSTPAAMNNAGLVVGTGMNASGESVVWSWQDGVFTELGSFGLDGPLVTGLNDSGEMSVTYHPLGNPTPGLVTADGIAHPLSLPEGCRGSADAINQAGEVVGNYSCPGDPDGPYPVIWEDPDGSPVGLPATRGYVLFVTDNGLAGGSAEVDDARQAVVWSLFASTATPDVIVQNLEATIAALVDGGALSKGNANSLTSKLDAALKQMDKGNAKAAANQLNAFINAVEALVKSGRLSAGDAATLLDGAHSAVDLLLD